MEKSNLPSFWEWTFKGRWYYILLAIWVLVNGSYGDRLQGQISTTEFSANVIGLAIILLVIFSIAYLVYKAGYKRAKVSGSV